MIRLILILFICSCSHKPWNGKYFWDTNKKVREERHHHNSKDINDVNYNPLRYDKHSEIIILHYDYLYRYRNYYKRKLK